ncbi:MULTISPECIES: DUF4426 domain-containing protein [unclassified Oleiphilus]|uniref:DUF4426 domain-containing protein n=1 Tax=unclassified Oleiphilus TaxID=2631174 RepID=UPI0008392494|nr:MULTISPECIES: DUF4426 domain-containing protein [unclassified Oleiphilus]
MLSRNHWIHVCLFMLGMLMAADSYAEQKKVFAAPDGTEYEVHYIAFNSTFLQPEVARQYDLTRSKALGVVNVSVLKVNENGVREAVGAIVNMNAKNDIQQVQHLSMQQVIEGKAIYYIAQLQYREGEILTFDISVFPQGVSDPFRLRFSHNFYND